MLNPPVVRVAVPAAIANQMKLWREGFVPMPTEYVQFHLGLAHARLDVLQATYGFRVVEAKLCSAGWFDGMKELNVIVETKSGSLLKLVWCDSNQDFMKKYNGGGSGVFGDETLR
jgi:hypothetical protein